MRTASNRIISISLALLLAFISLAIMLPAGTQAGCPTSRIYPTPNGNILILNSGVCIANAQPYAPTSFPCTLPYGYSFPYGMATVSLYLPGESIRGTITAQLPNPLPLAAKFYQCINGTLVDITAQFTRVNEYTIVWTITATGEYTVTLGIPYTTGAGVAAPQSSSPWLPETAKAPVQLANISVKSASLSSTKVTPGEKVTVTADIANTGTGNGTSNIKVYINGAEEAQQGVSVSSGGTTTVIFDVTRNEPGTYTVYVGSANAGSFTVDQFTPNTILYISGALVFFALVIGVIWMTRRRA